MCIRDSGDIVEVKSSDGFLNEKTPIIVDRIADVYKRQLQDSPDEIPELYRMITQDGYDLVSGWKQKRYRCV